MDRRQQSHKGYKGRSGSEDVAHFDVVFNLRKQPAVRRASSAKQQIDLVALVEALTKDPIIASRGLQGVHAEVMRRVASNGSATFVDYADVRIAWEGIKSAGSAPAD
jgi:hypothetical protein